MKLESGEKNNNKGSKCLGVYKNTAKLKHLDFVTATLMSGHSPDVNYGNHLKFR